MRPAELHSPSAEKTARPRMFRHFVPSRELHSLAPLMRLSPVDLPSADGFKTVSYTHLDVYKRQTLDFLPLDRSGNRRFMPIMVNSEQSKHLEMLADEESLQELYEKISKSIHNLPLSVIQANKEGKNS